MLLVARIKTAASELTGLEQAHDAARWNFYRQCLDTDFAQSKRGTFLYLEVWCKIEEACDVAGSVAPVLYLFSDELRKTPGALKSDLMRIDVVQTFERGVSLKDAVVVVVDVFRASTTIVSLFEREAERVVPCADVEDIEPFLRGRQRVQWITVGERDGKPVPNLDYSNEPSTFLELEGDIVKGRSFLMTTTSGTRALLWAKDAQSVLVGCLRNLNAVAALAYRTAGQHPNRVVVVAVGDDGGRVPNDEDTMVANLIAQRIKQYAETSWLGGSRFDPTITKERVRQLSATRNASKLRQYDRDSDVQRCMEVDTTAVVPVLRDGDLVNGVRKPNLPQSYRDKVPRCPEPECRSDKVSTVIFDEAADEADPNLFCRHCGNTWRHPDLCTSL